MKFNVLCKYLAKELNEDGYTPKIANNDREFNALFSTLLNRNIEQYRMENSLSKGKTLSEILTTDYTSTYEKELVVEKIRELLDVEYQLKNEDSDKAIIDKIDESFSLNKTFVSQELDKLFIRVSRANTSFNNLNNDEKLREINQVTENRLLSFTDVRDIVSCNWKKYSYNTLNDKYVKDYRSKIQCFRHGKEKALDEISTYTEEQKDILIAVGLHIVCTIELIYKYEVVKQLDFEKIYM